MWKRLGSYRNLETYLQVPKFLSLGPASQEFCCPSFSCAIMGISFFKKLMHLFILHPGSSVLSLLFSQSFSPSLQININLRRHNKLQ